MDPSMDLPMAVKLNPTKYFLYLTMSSFYDRVRADEVIASSARNVLLTEFSVQEFERLRDQYRRIVDVPSPECGTWKTQVQNYITLMKSQFTEHHLEGKERIRKADEEEQFYREQRVRAANSRAEVIKRRELRAERREARRDWLVAMVVVVVVIGVTCIVCFAWAYVALNRK